MENSELNYRNKTPKLTTLRWFSRTIKTVPQTSKTMFSKFRKTSATNGLPTEILMKKALQAVAEKVELVSLDSSKLMSPSGVFALSEI